MAFNKKFRLSRQVQDDLLGLLAIAGFAGSLLVVCFGIMVWSILVVFAAAIPFAVGMGALKGEFKDNVFFEFAYIGTGVALTATGFATFWPLLWIVGIVMLLPIFLVRRNPDLDSDS